MLPHIIVTHDAINDVVPRPFDGSKIRSTAEFHGATNDLFDDSAVTVKAKNLMTGVAVTYVYPAAEVVKDAVGRYHFDYTAAAGGHSIRWSSATCNPVEQQFSVQPQVF